MATVLRLAAKGCWAGGPRPAVLQGPLVTQWTRAVFTSPSAAALKSQSAEDYWAKNKRLRRPVSPHLTIYKPQITSMLSITHRGTGLALSVLVSGLGIGTVMLPGSYPHYLAMVQAMQFGGGIIMGAKFLIALPFMFHLCNGVRHLVWDLGYGFTLRALYKSGYLVVAVSVILAAIAAAM
ncbi:succinate dehydrogenase cytochrome b560 subunit, mitochondrial-like [Portunus trituberculatus]|uniref:Mitochondrial succinate dehydrogenase cytochrome b560 subunit n=1 Tax=Portunus trituberculatus TaxID=210409 RepID=A0A1X9PWN7_PORTR|nr:succinate dehydrogenase cytochrome b560 subunit, mitochondrial-like [Portunus trituberculatus]ARO92229.1 mitochondrial succinate dehydrogenase cytochrome b560 subunit [Portunus trituberculatus]MPC26016.1 Succinate dehydrogenase cytochrome b560 subunit, mitochondrial [Portunus trituberculatus]